MKAIFNSRVIKISKTPISISNRAFCYGDGLFETIVTAPQRIDLKDKHIERLKRGCEVLGIDFPEELSPDFLGEKILQLSEENGLTGNVRTKLILWRNEGGLYAPEGNSASYLIECKTAQKPFFRANQRIGLSESCHTSYSPLSFAKTLSSLNYVLAGREMKLKGLDEIILTDHFGNVSETHLGNLFWVKDGMLFTPALSTGCIEGIMRNAIIDMAKEAKIPLSEVLMKTEDLQKVDSLVSTNASGITYYDIYESQNLESPEAFLQPILKRLLQP